MVGILVSFWDGLFSGAMLVSGSIVTKQLFNLGIQHSFGEFGSLFQASEGTKYWGSMNLSKDMAVDMGTCCLGVSVDSEIHCVVFGDVVVCLATPLKSQDVS